MSVYDIAGFGNRAAVDSRWISGGISYDPTILPPHNIPAEQALLGALLINNQSAEYISELEPHHFYSDLHGRMFEAMSEALLAGRTFTATTLAERFRTVRISDDMDGAQYLGRLMAEATTIRNVREYARIVIEAAQRRTLIVVAEKLATRAFDPNERASPAALIEEAERDLFHAANRQQSSQESTFAEAVEKALAAAAKAYQSGGEIDGVQTGFIDLDKKLGGLGNSDLIILAGRPSMGKTALALNVATNVAQTGDHVHFFSLEMSDEQLANRQMAEDSGIASDRIRRGDFDEDEYRLLDRSARRLAGLPITINRTGGISLSALSANARRIKRRHNTKLIVIDYLQLMSAAGGKGGNRVQDVTEITMGLKALAKDLNVPVIALSQLSREVEKRTDKRPQLSDLRESGSIEQDADVVMFVFREEYYVERTKPSDDEIDAITDWQHRMANASGKAEVIIGKQRHGSVGIVEMAFDAARTRFSDLAREDAP